MQEAQASQKAGRGNPAWDPYFATALRRLRLVERHQIAARYVGDPLYCFLLHIDLFPHSADMMAQGPSSHLYSHSTHGTLIKRLAGRFTGITVNTSHQGQSILQCSILTYWTLSGIDPGTKSTTSTTTGYQFPSGIGTSGAGFAEIQGKMSSDGEGFMEAYSSMAKPPGYTEETLNLSMTAQQPPSYDEKVSWFRNEELVGDWVTITTVEAPKRGPLLKSRLTGDADMYKAVLQNDLLQDPDEGVNYFKNTLKKYFLKGATNVYLYRLLSFFNHRRQNQEILIFTSKLNILLMRLKAAWMGLMPIFTGQSPTFRQSVQDANARTIARHQQAAGTRVPPPVLLDDPTVLRQYITGMQDRQRDAFPFGDNLLAQFFIIQSALSDQQRERLTSAMSLRNISLENYSYEMLKTHYHELFITTRTSIQHPSIRPQGNRSNTFFVIEQGEYEGEEGLWVEDEEGLEGFMSNNDEETFWVLEENDAFIARKVSGRNFRFKKRKGNGKSGNKKWQSPTRWLQTLQKKRFWREGQYGQ